MVEVPKSYFENDITTGLVNGIKSHMKNERFTIVRLPVGYGKTVLSVRTVADIAKENGGSVQLAIIAPKAKRLDNSFVDALCSAEDLYGVSFDILEINNEEVGTFEGFVSMTKKPKTNSMFRKKILAKPTIFILDETHKNLRQPTSVTSKRFKSLFDYIDKEGGYLKVLGLTATPFDRSILDCIGYLVFNGNYSSREQFYRDEIVGYEQGRKNGVTVQSFEKMILDYDYVIHPEMFFNSKKIEDEIKNILYNPDSIPKTFKIPDNDFEQVRVQLTEKTNERLKQLRAIDRMNGFEDKMTRRNLFTNAWVSDENMQQKILSVIQDEQTIMPIVFYQYNVQLNTIKKTLEDNDIPYVEINGSSQSFFEQNLTEQTVILVQYLSGASAFESKESNVSIYLEFPDSAINFQQSLGRNTRRDQKLDKVYNYLFLPITKQGKVESNYAAKYNSIYKKTIANDNFLKAFSTPWNTYEAKKTDLLN